jgi:RHS repeat-associated protein
MDRGGQTFFYHTDGLGSITQITDSAKQTVASYTYDAFGNITSQTGSLNNSYTYTGREYDQESGLHYYRARYYDPKIGRFLQPDPLGMGMVILIRQYSPGSPISRFLYHSSLGNPLAISNVYSYVGNNPINFVDPLGLKSYDYISGNLNIAIPNPWTLTFFGWSGQIVLDRYGNVYVAPLGATLGKSYTFVSGSLTLGILGEWCTPSEDKLKDFLSGHSVNFHGGYWGGFGGTKNLSSGAEAFELGFVTPQAGLSYHYSWFWKKIGIK